MNDFIYGGLWVYQSILLVQLQDCGCFGCCYFGVIQGGVFDWLFMGWVNWLLGNFLDVVVIEIVFGGFVVECCVDGWLVLVGGDFGVIFDGQLLLVWGVFVVCGGQCLVFVYLCQGVCVYLVVFGGFVGECQLGSLVMVVCEGLGGFCVDGKVLVVGDSFGWLVDGV